ncbi:hypothetical protein IAT38_007100 [Cryptococcus sp. DSM 104549]
MTSTPVEPNQELDPARVPLPSSSPQPIANTTDPSASEVLSARLSELTLLGRKLVKSLKRYRRQNVCHKQQFLAAFEKVMAVYSECVRILEMEGIRVSADADTWRKLLCPSIEYLTDPEPHEVIREFHLYNLTSSFRGVVTYLTRRQRELASRERSA